MNPPPIGVIIEEIEQELYKMFPFLRAWRTAKIYEGVKEILEKVLLKHFWTYRDYVTQKVIEDLNRDRKENLERKQKKESPNLIGEQADMKKNQDWVTGLVKPQEDNDK